MKSAHLAKKRVGGRGVGIHSFNILPSRDIICDTQTAVNKRFQPPHPTNRQYLCSNRGELSGIGFVCGLWWLGLLVEDNLGITYGILTWQNVKRVNPNPSSPHFFFRQLSRVGSPKERQCYIIIPMVMDRVLFQIRYVISNLTVKRLRRENSTVM